MSGNIRDREQVCILDFVSYLRAAGIADVECPKFLDGCESGSGLPDAIAEPFCIEHTSIDSFSEQRRRNAQFLRCTEHIPARYRDKLGYCLCIAFSKDAIQTGQDWKKIRDALCKHIDSLPAEFTGCMKDDTIVKDVPFPVRIWRSHASQCDGVRFCRLVDDQEEFCIADTLLELLEEKAKKLENYLKKNVSVALRALIIVESDDDALMDANSFLRNYKHAFPEGIRNIDVWFCQRSGNDIFVLCTKTGRLDLFDKDSSTLRGDSTFIALEG